VWKYYIHCTYLVLDRPSVEDEHKPFLDFRVEQRLEDQLHPPDVFRSLTSDAISFNRVMSSWFAQCIWNPLPAFSVSARRMTKARSCLWTFPYLSFFLIALEAS